MTQFKCEMATFNKEGSSHEDIILQTKRLMEISVPHKIK